MPYTEKSLGLFLGDSLRRPVLVRRTHYLMWRLIQALATWDPVHVAPIGSRAKHTLACCQHCCITQAPGNLACDGHFNDCLHACMQEHTDVHKNIALSYAAYRVAQFLMVRWGLVLHADQECSWHCEHRKAH